MNSASDFAAAGARSFVDIPPYPAPNRTGMPDHLKAGIEHLSGISTDDVRVHYASPKPGRFQALALAQGNHIYVAPGQERHLAHEAWHVVQQKQGRVKAEASLKGEPLNDDKDLEREADVMGRRALAAGTAVAGRSGAEIAARTSPAGAAGIPAAGVIQPVWDSHEVDAEDHGEAGGSEERLVDWSELRGDPPRPLLYQIFVNLAQYHYDKAEKIFDEDIDLRQPFGAWLRDGVFTRQKFKQLIGLEAGFGDNQAHDIIQAKRDGDTYSFNGNYYGTSNGEYYDNVIYYRSDPEGNIDFDENPRNIRNKFNQVEGLDVRAADIKWKDPVRHASKVSLNNYLADRERGIMPSGKSIHIPSATREQHFAIADMLYPAHNRQATWTWHHLTEEYKMVLVDMRVHAKHGHNGGVFLW